MAFAQLPSYPPFDAKSEGVAVRWSKWVSRLTNNLFVAYDITDESRKKALLLTYVCVPEKRAVGGVDFDISANKGE